MLGIGYVISLWHSLDLPYNYFEDTDDQKLLVKNKTDSDMRLIPVVLGTDTIVPYRYLKQVAQSA